jgi:hypothetical protein
MASLGVLDDAGSVIEGFDNSWLLVYDQETGEITRITD